MTTKEATQIMRRAFAAGTQVDEGSEVGEMTEEEREAIVRRGAETYFATDAPRRWTEDARREHRIGRVLEAVGFWELVEAAEAVQKTGGCFWDSEEGSRIDRALDEALQRVKGAT